MKKIIAGLFIILILLFIISLLFSKKSANTQPQSQDDQPLSDSSQTIALNNNLNTTRTIYPTLSVQAKQNEVEAVNAKVLSIDQAKRFLDVRKKLPISAPDFDIGYSPLLDQYFIAQKKPSASFAVNKFLAENNLSDIKNSFPSLFAMTTQPIDQAISKAEDTFLKNTKKGKYSQNSSPTDSSVTEDLFNLADILQNNPYFTDGEQAVEQTESTVQQPIYKPGDISSLDAIITEASIKVDVPLDLIYEVAQKSCGTFVSLPSSKIRIYSVPGSGLPQEHPCFDNHLTFDCCLGPLQLKKTAWQIYATAAQDIGEYAHEPNIENVRDSLYAASKKLKVDGDGGDKNSWTKSQYQLALQNYNKSCDNPFYPTYCSDLWQNYFNNK